VNARANSHADEYKAPMEMATALSISGALPEPGQFLATGPGVVSRRPPMVHLYNPPLGGPLWITHAAESIRNEMSGSLIVTEIGTAIGVVCTAAAPWEGGPNPRLTHNLPGWLLRDPSCPDPQWGGRSAP